MQVNNEGHIVTAEGHTTAPAIEAAPYYVGNTNRFISFAYMILPNDTKGRVVIHSTLCDTVDGFSEDFLYEVVKRHEAVRAAATMVVDAEEYLDETGSYLDENQSAMDFIACLKQSLKGGLH